MGSLVLTIFSSLTKHIEIIFIASSIHYADFRKVEESQNKCYWHKKTVLDDQNGFHMIYNFK